MSRPKIMGDSLEHWRRLCIEPDGRIRPTAAFCHDVRSAEALAQRWREAGYRAMPVSGTSCKGDRRRAREGLQGGGLDLVASADMWLAGVDIPEIAALLVERGTESLRVWLQMCGRGLRIATQWPDLLILDHAGNLRRPGIGSPLQRRMHLWDLDAGRKRRKGDPAPAVTVCERCYSCDVVNGACQECGHVRETRLPWGPRSSRGS
jgi:superfamily II DNA or RNA helicase